MSPIEKLRKELDCPYYISEDEAIEQAASLMRKAFSKLNETSYLRQEISRLRAKILEETKQ